MVFDGHYQKIDGSTTMLFLMVSIHRSTGSALAKEPRASQRANPKSKAGPSGDRSAVFFPTGIPSSVSFTRFRQSPEKHSQTLKKINIHRHHPFLTCKQPQLCPPLLIKLNPNTNHNHNSTLTLLSIPTKFSPTRSYKAFKPRSLHPFGKASSSHNYTFPKKLNKKAKETVERYYQTLLQHYHLFIPREFLSPGN